MADAKFTILGMTGSGKTCYLLGMYAKMSGGIEGYSISTNDDMSVDLRNRYMKMRRGKGNDRFPGMTDKMSKYTFDLNFNNQSIFSFDWLDYYGGMLETKNEGDFKGYQELKETIRKSSCLFICVDGDYLRGDNIEDKIDDIRYDCSNVINEFFTDYFKENKTLPPTAILITKYDKCAKDTNSEEIYTIMKKCFSPLFTESRNSNINRFVTIIPITLGMNIAEDNYGGRFKPHNIELPIYLGIWFAQQDVINSKITEMRKTKEKYNKEISRYNKERADEQDSFFLWRDNEKINKLSNIITDTEKIKRQNLEKIRHLIDVTQNNSSALLKELTKIPSIYVNGKEIKTFEEAAKIFEAKKPNLNEFNNINLTKIFEELIPALKYIK